jgi:hypothetical protein
VGKSPKPPDPYAQAAAQQSSELGASMGSSIINNPNVVSPYGTQTYNIAGYETIYDAQGKPQYVPRYTQTQTLSPDQQRLMGLNTQMQYNMGQTGVEQSGKLRGLLGQSVNTEGLQGWQAANAPGAISTAFRQDQAPTDRAAVENAMMTSYNRARTPQQEAENAQLAARGLSPGGAGYGRVQQGREDALGEAARQAYLASGQESRQAQDAYNQVEQMRNAAEQQKYQLGADWSSQLNQLRQAQLQERLGLRNQPLNEISALLSGSQVTMPQFNPFSAQGIGAAPIGSYMGQNYSNALQASNAQNAGLFGLGGSAMGALGTIMGGPLGGMAGAAAGSALSRSDRRLKEDITPLGGNLAGAPLYAFRYIGSDEPTIGVMADEVRPLHPDAVHQVDGYDMVDYGLLLSRHEGE